MMYTPSKYVLNIVMCKGNVILEQRDFRLTSVQLATRDDVNDCEKSVVWLMSARLTGGFIPS